MKFEGIMHTRPMRLLPIKNAESAFSLVEAVPLPRIDVSVTKVGADYRAQVRAAGESFSGNGGSAVVALQAVVQEITASAIKRFHHGAPTKRVRIAATLLQGEAI